MPDALYSEVTKAELAHRGWRMVKDRLFGLMMGVGGVTVIVALVTIFFYLLWVVIPLFRPAALSAAAEVALPAGVVHVSTNEQGDVLFTVAADGSYRFLRAGDGKLLGEGSLVPAGARVEAGVGDFRGPGLLALALDGGRAVIAKPAYRISFPNGVRTVTPTLSWPIGAEPIALTADGAALARLAVASADERTTIAAVDADGTLRLTHLAPGEGLLLDDEAPSFETTSVEVTQLPAVPDALLVDGDQQELYVLAGREVGYWNIRDKEQPKLDETVQLVPPGVEITELRFLAGGHSLLVGDSRGHITQWFPVRDEANNFRLTRIREFTALTRPVRRIAPEWFRKGFIAIDAEGTLGVFHATAERTLLTAATGVADALVLAISPRADTVLVVGQDGGAKRYGLVNEHPEVSWRSLWGKVWYEGRAQPEFIWQSSSASSDFEPKFSLTPLAFGTLKAAFYALFFAVPLAILGAMYTAYFMHPKLRAVVKPSIEIMAALPTVILGFLAGLWLAPIIESHLIGVFLAMLLMPLSVGLASYAWSIVPAGLRRVLPPGREVLLIVPLLVGAVALAMILSQPLEQIFFDGNLPRWLSTELGMSYDQRNSLVVGIAMGFAVIPNIFSISEDAIFAVPRQLTTGSLALGATPWQTMARVVLLTASPGIFSAVMIGLGRAVGETMIVLMSTGNTPVMDASIFQGFRALSANIAVEMPESEVDSTHYRVLFLAALVLFLVTFVFNTVAEIVRQRLRRRYGNL
ncbi:MAG TPA: ABC transporter permease subunit [Gammaproteobacteria bacterium]|nr:ABC transporter permease subunit [Gammaproteobacteria bacterium]